MSEQGLASPSLLFQSCLILEILTLHCSYYCHMGMHINNFIFLMQDVEVQDSFLKESYIDCGQLAKTLAMHCNIVKYYTVIRVVA